jgi:hypothetical protein
MVEDTFFRLTPPDILHPPAAARPIDSTLNSILEFGDWSSPQPNKKARR